MSGKALLFMSGKALLFMSGKALAAGWLPCLPPSISFRLSCGEQSCGEQSFGEQSFGEQDWNPNPGAMLRRRVST